MALPLEHVVLRRSPIIIAPQYVLEPALDRALIGKPVDSAIAGFLAPTAAERHIHSYCLSDMSGP